MQRLAQQLGGVEDRWHVRPVVKRPHLLDQRHADQAVAQFVVADEQVRVAIRRPRQRFLQGILVLGRGDDGALQAQRLRQTVEDAFVVIDQQDVGPGDVQACVIDLRRRHTGARRQCSP